MKITVLYSILFLMACSAGKKAFERGDYDGAVLKAVHRLRTDPDNRKASATLAKAYPIAKKWHLDNIRHFNESGKDLKWEGIINEYMTLNNLYDEIQRCPSCLTVIKRPDRYTTEFSEAKKNAAEIRYEMGERELSVKTREAAKEAYYHFLKVDQLVPGFREVDNKIMTARYMATLKVVLPPIPVHVRNLQLSSEFFENKIREYLRGLATSEFVRFYEPAEARKYGIDQPDQEIFLQFDEFAVGQTFMKEKQTELRKDSVKVGEVKLKDGTKQDVYGDVKATMHVFRKTVVSNGILDFKIIDPETKAVLTQEKFPGEFVWFCEWGYFNGDERALDDAQKNIVKAKELMPPPPQDLFIEFTRPIYDQLTQKLKAYYRNY